MNKLNLFLLAFCSLTFGFLSFSQEKKEEKKDIKVLISTFLGNEKRNYYGNKAPEKLDLIWKIWLGEGLSPAYNYDKVWKGSGWTGQPLLIRENGELFLIQGAFDYNLKKIRASNGELIWQNKFDDIIKATPTIWENPNPKNPDDKYIIMQGSRFGYWRTLNDKYIPSFRAVSYLTGKELWRLNVKKTESSSRDVDGSAVVIHDTAYIGLENSIFTVFDPNPDKLERIDGVMQPKIYQEINYFTPEDVKFHENDIAIEASPTFLNGKIYTSSGSGSVYGYNISKKANDWAYYIGTDLNSTAPVTDDNCLLVGVEKQYMPGSGGVMKIDPSKTGNACVVWYYPTPDIKWYHWDGGLIGSIACNDAYVDDKAEHFAVFLDISGDLTVVDHQKLEKGKFVLGPDNKTKFPTPKLIAKVKVPGTIATPLIVDDKIVAPTDSGLFLFKLVKKDKTYNLELLDKVPTLPIDATPIVWDGRLYIGVRDGYMYCFGKKD